MFDLTLTFDNGPEPEATPMVLDILARRGVLSTFFVIGEKLAQPRRRAMCERAKAEGHWIGNHTWTHSGPFGHRREASLAEREIGRTQEELAGLSHPSRYFRPQGGGGRLGRHLLTEEIVSFLKGGGYSCVLWNAVPRDWDDADGWVARALAACHERSWTLMVLHDLPAGAPRNLDRFLGQVADKGGRVRQDFPADCVPVADGIVTGALESYVAAKE